MAHGDHDAGVVVGAQDGFESGGLSHGVLEDGAFAADFIVVVLHFAGARGGDEFGERLAGDAGEGEVDDIGVAEEVIEEGLDTLRGIRPA